MSTSTLLKNAKDLTKQAPRSPGERIGGYALMARMIDKGRATINGTNGEYHFDCPLDNMLFGFKGLVGSEVKAILASGASDDEIATWINQHGQKKTSEEIKAWSEATEKVSFYNVPEKKEWFIDECKRLGLDPARTTLFQYLDKDDQVSYPKK
jgi:uncharacterized protein DUF5069